MYSYWRKLSMSDRGLKVLNLKMFQLMIIERAM